MKQFFALSLLVLSISCFSQSTYPIRADKVLIEKVGGNAELQLKNGTRDSLYGILTNIGAGQTAFLKIKKISDSSFAIGLDTVTIKGNNPRPGDDMIGDIFDFDLVDTATYSTACTISELYYKKVIPEIIGKRIRVTVSGIEYLPDSSSCSYYSVNGATGELKVFPGFDHSLYPIPGSDRKIKISFY